MKLVVAKSSLANRKVSIDCDKIFDAKQKNQAMTKLQMGPTQEVIFGPGHEWGTAMTGARSVFTFKKIDHGHIENFDANHPKAMVVEGYNMAKPKFLQYFDSKKPSSVGRYVRRRPFDRKRPTTTKTTKKRHSVKEIGFEERRRIERSLAHQST